MKEISGLHITILGAVRSGIAAAKLARKMNAIPFVTDYSKKLETVPELDRLNIAYELGGHSEKAFNCDLIITSPGVPSDASIIIEAQKKGIKIISEIEFASWFCKGKIIAITGSNGKTTTTALCTHLLNSADVKTYSAGNIGIAFSEIVLDVKENEYVALEVSSFQLDFIDSFRPTFAIILNITQDHLDRYENDFRKYAASKMRVFENQKEEDYLIINEDDTFLKSNISSVNYFYGISQSSKSANGCYINNDEFVFVKDGTKDVVCAISSLKIKGEHNQYNAMTVVTIAKIIGIKNNKIAEALSSFAGVEHRLEFVRNLNGVEFINDSKATNVDSVWYALRSFNYPIRLILGGKDKGNNYNTLLDEVKKRVVKIYAIGLSAEKVFNYFSTSTQVEVVDTLENTVVKAYDESNSGDVILLSPACASFDMFDDYEHRGRVFKQSVMQLKK